MPITVSVTHGTTIARNFNKGLAVKLTPIQYAALIMQLATLAQVDLSDNAQDDLAHLEAMLEMALANVRAYIPLTDIVKARLRWHTLKTTCLESEKGY
jgi:hypothetical protein